MYISIMAERTRVGRRTICRLSCIMEMENNIIMMRYLRVVAILGRSLGLMLNLIFL